MSSRTTEATGSDPTSSNATAGLNPVTAVTICPTPGGCGSNGEGLARGEEIGVEKNAPQVEGHPLTSVVVTQCNLVVAVYMTMPDGRLLRFDSKADVEAEQLVNMAYTATRSERVEVSCQGLGPSGFETHEPV
ncbi:hypothetical protein JM946_11825 [Steroidobacter sp. S1-65]|uniref:Uncharacterized protein n=1 Tax=Steroidobacter gossypii TaxID=2805490 RepID=A0ABS1WWW5_9GAMM|nr:hypothetical protein [Steroidobacter gossypii]MBM0105443.1 hypothetical protein [Steroidobacter gossypii]